jgi:hypothetical protein
MAAIRTVMARRYKLSAMRTDFGWLFAEMKARRLPVASFNA